MRPAVCDRDCFGVHFAEPLAQGFPCVRHCAYDRAARLVHYISRPQLAHLRSLRSCQLCDDCRRKTTSLARVRGVKPESPALSLVLEYDDELSFETPDAIAEHCSTSRAASAGMRNNLPPRRKARNSPLLIRLRTCRSLHPHSAASDFGV